MAYDSRAREFAFKFFAAGWSKERALPEIRKEYAGFSGSTWDAWRQKYDWDGRRAAADAKVREFDGLCQNLEISLLKELNEVRGNLYAKLQNGAADNQTVYAYTSVVRRIAEMSQNRRSNQDAHKVSAQVLSEAVESLLSKLSQVNGLGPALQKHAPEVGQAVTEVAEEYGQGAAG